MASHYSPSGRKQRHPLEGLVGDPGLHPHPTVPRTDLPGSSSWSSWPADFHSENLPPPAQTAFPGGPLKALRCFLPASWKDSFRGGPRAASPSLTSSPGLQGSPAEASLSEPPQRAGLDGEGVVVSSSSRGQGEAEEDCPSTPGKTVATTSPGGASTALPEYQEKGGAFEHKYAHLKSWPGLLRLLGGLELILGGMVFAGTAASIQKDYQGSELSANPLLPYGGLSGGGGHGYYGPMTPFVLVVASLVWLLTVILLGLGVTMYYQTILLNSPWWPLTEFTLNLLMFLLYMAAAIAYLNGLNRGGLCYSALAYGPLVTALCRVDGGQVAAVTFLFLTPLLYLAGFLICLKMWTHQAARRMLVPPSRPLPRQGTLEQAVPREKTHPAGRSPSRHVGFFSEEESQRRPGQTVPEVGHKPHTLPDYILKYPALASQGEREKYKAIFYDQYSEYRELHHEIQATRSKFKELEALMLKLPRPKQNKEQSRVSAVWRDYQRKRKDPAFREKQERGRYLRRKLSHLKAQIQAFDSAPSEPSMLL